MCPGPHRSQGVPGVRALLHPDPCGQLQLGARALGDGLHVDRCPDGSMLDLRVLIQFVRPTEDRAAERRTKKIQRCVASEGTLSQGIRAPSATRARMRRQNMARGPHTKNVRPRLGEFRRMTVRRNASREQPGRGTIPATPWRRAWLVAPWMQENRARTSAGLSSARRAR